VRLPPTTTGTSLLGIVKHALNTEAIYFGRTFGREWATPDQLVSPDGPDPLAGWYATDTETETETTAGIVDLYRRVEAFADESIDALPLDAIGRIAHWGREEVTLHEIMVIHKTVDLQRHAGHADILREQLDGSVGLLPGNSNSRRHRLAGVHPATDDDRRPIPPNRVESTRPRAWLARCERGSPLHPGVSSDFLRHVSHPVRHLVSVSVRHVFFR